MGSREWMKKVHSTLASGAASSQCRCSTELAPPRRRRAAERPLRWAPTANAWWRQLTLLLIGLPAMRCQNTPVPLVRDENYNDIYGVAGSDSLNRYRKVGPGECLAPASRPVRGRARMDMTHLECRERCFAPCIGYTYFPCERICTLHGDGEKLENTTDAEGWTTVNGGGSIKDTSQRCGSSCYERLAPCAPDKVISNAAILKTGHMAFGSQEIGQCPLPYVGKLQYRCGLYGPFPEAGRCRSPCLAGSITQGNFDITFHQFLHGEEIVVGCPSGANGLIQLACNDGKVKLLSGRCGYNCVLGSIEVGDAVIPYPGMNHSEVIQDIECPQGTYGNVTLYCFDSRVKATNGTCSYNCDPGEIILRVGDIFGSVTYESMTHGETNETDCLPDNNFTGRLSYECYRGKVSIIEGGCRRHCQAGIVGPRDKEVKYPRFDDGTEITLLCDHAAAYYYYWSLPPIAGLYEGVVELKCDDGNATIIKGECLMHCAAGAVTSNSVRLDHPKFNDSESMTLFCPEPSHAGNVTITCSDGAVRFTGMCGENCGPGAINSHGAWAAWELIDHGTIANVSCPEPYVGSIYVRCYDGTSRYWGEDVDSAAGGWCGRPCPGGAINANGAVVFYDGLNHTQSKVYTCSSLFDTGLTFSGGVTITCDDGLVNPGGYCEADCPDGTMWSNGAQIFYPGMIHLESAIAICSPGTVSRPLYGRVVVKCISGYSDLISGSCGAPCLAGSFSSSETRDDPVIHPDIAHATSHLVICPSHLSGMIELYCDSGVLGVIGNGTCGDRCPAAHMPLLYGAEVYTPVMEHRAVLTYPCTKPGFNGYVLVQCDFGLVNATSLCAIECNPGNVSLLYGAVIKYPAMMSGDYFQTRCPPGQYLDMPVVIKCHDGQGYLHEGGCFKNCDAGWFYDPAYEEGKSWSLQHYLILHDSESVETCPQYYNGYVTLKCYSGVLTREKGGCTVNCRPGRKQIRPGVVVRNAEMITGELAAQIPCPIKFDGSMRLLCTEGEISLGAGGCNATCPPGVMETAPYGELGDSKTSRLACPDTGTINIICNDGTISKLDGKCYVGCDAGAVTDANGTRIEYPFIRHNETFPGACAGLARGIVTVRCNNTKVTQAPRLGERCLRFCQTKPVTTPLGTTIFPPNTAHGNQATVRCPNDMLGLVTVTCFDTEFKVIDGECGEMNCAEGTVESNGADLPHYAINNGWRAGPTTCEEPWEGIATFSCSNGTTEVEEVTIQLPASPEDLAAVAIGNESSEDSRFVLCGCCSPKGEPAGAPPVQGKETGIYVWVAITGGIVALLVAAISGWYFLPRKKMSRVWPEKPKPDDPRPVAEESLNAILDQFHMKLKDSPNLAQTALERNLHLKALPPAEQKQAIEDMKKNPKEAKKFFTRRSVQYLLAVEEAVNSPPLSPKSVTSKSSKGSRKQQSSQLALGDAAQASEPPQQPALGWHEVTSPMSVDQEPYAVEDMPTRTNRSDTFNSQGLASPSGTRSPASP